MSRIGNPVFEIRFTIVKKAFLSTKALDGSNPLKVPWLLITVRWENMIGYKEAKFVKEAFTSIE